MIFEEPPTNTEPLHLQVNFEEDCTETQDEQVQKLEEIHEGYCHHCKEVEEVDPNFLLKMISLLPEKKYVPTFLRGA